MPDDKPATPQVDAAVQDAVNDARAEEQARAHDEWKARIEQDIRELRAGHAAAAPQPAPVAPEPPAAPVVAAPPADDKMGAVADALESLKEAVTTPVAAAAEVASDVIDTTTDAAEDVVEEVAPVRKHGLFRSVFGGNR